jgi:Fic family protein
MTWNWESKNWPNFQWDMKKFAKVERLFIEGAAVMVGATRHIHTSTQTPLLIELLTTEAIDTSKIEGEFLNRGSVQSSISKKFGISTNSIKSGPAEKAISEMLVDSYQTLHKPLTKKMLCDWHKMLMSNRNDLPDIGKYRTHAEPMLIVSGPDYARKIHFEAPPSKQVPANMNAFVNWIKSKELIDSPLVKAGIAHLWFESIHPFEDGNGRIGRMIAEKTLSQAFEEPVITVLAKVLLKRRKQYYQALEKASKTLEITDWLLWFSSAVIESQKETLSTIDFIIEKTKFLDALKGQLNHRQEKAVLRMLQEGPSGFKGGLTAAKYHQMTGATTATTTRDLQSLVKIGALRREGDKKSTRYFLTITLHPVKTVKISDIL